MKNNIQEKSFQFGLLIIKLHNYLTKDKKEYILSRQVIRSGTSIGAQIVESQYAESRLDFIHKMRIALKECNETIYWLKLLYHSEIINEFIFNELFPKNEELKKILITIINKARQNTIKKSN